MKKIIDFLKKPQHIVISVIVVAVISLLGYFSLTPRPAEIPLGFTLISSSTDGKSVNIYTLEPKDAKDLRVMYTTGLLIIENKIEKSDPENVSAPIWYYRTDVNNPFVVRMANGTSVTREIKNVMIATNDCPQDQTCPAGIVRLRTTDLQEITITTSRSEYVIVNP